ncbi:MAG: universal stress protein [Eggerthellaceae bacterium]|jgi:nucleotide-binding universal stress UspA family protein
MALQKILVPIDQSDGARRAVQVATELAQLSTDVHLDIVHVVPIPVLSNQQTESFQEILDMMIEDGKELLSHAADDASAVVDQIDTMLLTGTDPALELMKLVEQRSYDLVVIGNRGLSGLKEYTGSVSLKLMHGTQTSILIAR